MRDALSRSITVLHRLEDGLLAMLLTLLVLLAVGQIGARLLFDTGWSWAEPAIRNSVLWLAILGALAATRDRQHIAIDALPRLFPPPLRRLAWALGQLFAALVCGLLAWGSFDLVQLELESGTPGIGDVPAWVVLLILPVGFLLIALRLLVAGLLPPPEPPVAEVS